ncbi:MAG: family 1 glycosylhydrolase [Phycisphaerales bacterium]|nr:family 1 glycosylhydrolase [Phycisphaerales bacterium]
MSPMPGFMFATGIENSYPVIAGRGGGVRVDQMEKCGHYEHWKEDLRLVAELGIHYLRWGPAIYKTFLGAGKYDFMWVDDVLEEMRRLGIQPIMDLCHFGVPDWLGNFQNEEFPAYFAEYAGEMAKRYPDAHYWTPVNEILVCATFSGLYGWWNERGMTDRTFVRAMLNLCKANVLAMRAILEYVPEAVFIQSESSEYVHPSVPRVMKRAHFLNQRRFVPLDLTYAKNVSAEVYRYLSANGMRAAEYDYFMDQTLKARCIMGTDYYVTNEHLVRPNGELIPSGEFFGYYVIAKQYYDRYGLPLMHTETNLWEVDGSVQWLWKEWNCMLRLRQDGVPIVGFTWYSLTDQMDWDTTLREDAHRVNTVGLYDLQRQIRRVGQNYKRLITDWREMLPAGSNALMLV